MESFISIDDECYLARLFVKAEISITNSNSQHKNVCILLAIVSSYTFCNDIDCKIFNLYNRNIFYLDYDSLIVMQLEKIDVPVTMFHCCCLTSDHIHYKLKFSMWCS